FTIECAVWTLASSRLPTQRRPNEISQPLQNIDTHSTPSKVPEAGEPVELSLKLRVGDKRSASCSQCCNHIAIARLFAGIVLQGPQKRRQTSRAGLDECRNENVVGAETHTQPTESGTRILIKRADFFSHISSIEDAEILG